MSTYKKYLPVLLLISGLGLLISLVIPFGGIDPDFFAYYYIGRGVSGGLNMFRDFIENKGPLLYLFFALLYRIFGSNYNLAVVFSNWFLDSIAIFFLVLLIERWTGFNFILTKFKHLLLFIFIILFYKSFSIGSFMAGTYSENLAFCLLLTSLFFFEKKKPIISGSLFVLAVLSRQSILFFAYYFLVLFLLKKKDKSFKPTPFLVKFLFPIIPLVLGILITGNGKDFINGFFLTPFLYFSAVKRNVLMDVLTRAFFETRILVSLFLSTIFVTGLTIREKGRDKKLRYLALFISSVLASFVGGYFFFHHFLQFSLFFLISIFLGFKLWKPVSTIAILTVSLFLISNFYFYISISKASGVDAAKFRPYQNLITNKQYLLVIPFYPQFYFDYTKKAPDKYYFSLPLNGDFYQNAPQNRIEHLNMNRDKLKNTLFLTITAGKSDKKMVDEYLTNFGPAFKLKKIDTLKSQRYTGDFYVSER